jgi:hypothetical protein
LKIVPRLTSLIFSVVLKKDFYKPTVFKFNPFAGLQHNAKMPGSLSTIFSSVIIFDPKEWFLKNGFYIGEPLP